MEFPEKESERIIKNIALQAKLLRFGFAAAEFFMIDSPDLPFWSCLFDLKTYKFIDVSANVKHHIGYDASEMEGKHMRKFLPNKEYVKSDTYIHDRQGINPTTADWFQNTYIHKDGSLVSFLWYNPVSQWEKSYQVMSIGFNTSKMKLI